MAEDPDEPSRPPRSPAGGGPSPSTGSEYADAVRDVLLRAAQSEAAAATRTPPPPRPGLLTSTPVVVLLALAFAGVAWYNVRAFTAQPAPLPPAEAEEAAGLALMVATQAVEQFRSDHGRLPESLEELGFPAGNIRYTVQGDLYTITSVHGEAAVQFGTGRETPDVLEEMGVELPPTSP